MADSRAPLDPGRRRVNGALVGLLAAATFGASTPFAKLLVDHVGAELLAGLLYLGAFVALGAAQPALGRRGEAPLRRSDVPRLAGIVVCGGVLAPALMLLGLQRVSGASGSLLLNLEGPFTLLVALAVFREHLDRRALLGAVAVFAGAGLLTTGGSTGGDTLIGVVLVAAACGLWAVDNNLTQSLTERDPFAIVLVKTGAAAAINLGVAGVVDRSDPVPPWGVAIGALALGAVSYGLSVVLDAYALRELGAAREAAIFGTAPFIGLVLSIPVLGHRPTVGEVAAAVVMAIGVVLLILERHAHHHVHEDLEHDHRHVHDDHHRHAHPPGAELADPTVPHSHPHRHAPVAHTHPHVSDAHHRHPH
ncbi:MAG: DMT family transporter [Acidimicrobiales bacterium]